MAKRILNPSPAVQSTLTPMEQQMLQQKKKDLDVEDAAGSPPAYQGFPGMPQPAADAAGADKETTANSDIPAHLLNIPGMEEALSIAQLQEEAGEDDPPAEDAAPEATAGGAAPAGDTETTAQICPWCGNQPDKKPPELDSNDKLKFIATITGPTRYKREYELFGGMLRVGFRSRTPWENEQIMRQLNAEVAAGEIATPADYAMRLTDYRLCAELDLFVRKDEIPIQFLEMKNLPFDKEKHPTPLPELFQLVFDSIFLNDVVRQAVGQSWLDFNSRLSYMVSRKDDPDFFTVSQSAP